MRTSLDMDVISPQLEPELADHDGYTKANSVSTAFTPHPCETVRQHQCYGDNCGGTYSSTRYAGDCDPDGCGFKSYRQGDTTFYGDGMMVDTSSVFTVVTQFVTDSSGDLSAIHRYYVQNGVVISSSESTVSGTSGNQIDTDFCSAQKTSFGDTDIFSQKGGLSQMGNAMKERMVLVLSLWDDVGDYILLLPLQRYIQKPVLCRRKEKEGQIYIMMGSVY
jgi:cellulose 1,4-beta-cellobiosidase